MPNAAQQERTDLLLERLPIEAHSVVADVGAGSGYFTLPIARRVHAGKVYAVDIQPEMLDLLRAEMHAQGLTNIVPTLGEVADPHLPLDSIDLALLVDAYHEFSEPRAVMEAIVAALKPSGRVVLVEYRGEDPRLPIHRLHKMTHAQVKEEMAAVGLEIEDVGAFLPQQHYFVLRKAGS